MDIRETLEALCSINGPSGFERPVAEKAAELLQPFMDETYLDRFGNAVGIRRCGKPGAKKLLLDAHLDQIGLMVTGMEDGYLRFCTIGGVDPRMLPDRELMILTEPPVLGVIACLPPHVQTTEDYNKSIPVSELWIDVGFSQEEVIKRIPIGTPAVFQSTMLGLGESQLSGKSMDDRSCFVALLRTAELLSEKELDVDLIILGSTREEISGAGARVGTFALAPDCCVAVDVTHGKTPDAPASKNRVFDLKGGPVIGIGPSMTRWMTARMIETATKVELPYQLEAMAGHSGTNGWHMQTVREGIATSVVSLPLKYMHSPIETLDIGDVESVARLLAAFTENLGREGAFGYAEYN